MATKTLTITEEAYERLAQYKGEQESFTEVIIKHFPKHSLLELVGIFSHEETAQLRKSIAESRKRSCERRERLAKRFP